MNGGQRLDFGGQRPDSLQIYILWISIPNARCMQNLGSFHPLGPILGPLSLTKRSFAVPFYIIKIVVSPRLLTDSSTCLIWFCLLDDVEKKSKRKDVILRSLVNHGWTIRRFFLMRPLVPENDDNVVLIYIFDRILHTCLKYIYSKLMISLMDFCKNM